MDDEEEMMRRMNPELFKTSEAHEDGEEEIMRKLNPQNQIRLHFDTFFQRQQVDSMCAYMRH